MFFYLFLLFIPTYSFRNSAYKLHSSQLFSLPIRSGFQNSPQFHRKYPLSHYGHARYIQRLHAKNMSNPYDSSDNDTTGEDMIDKILKQANNTNALPGTPGLRIIINKDMFGFPPSKRNGDDDDDDDEDILSKLRSRSFRQNQRKSSENFEVVKDSGITFENVGGYHNVKKELDQCIDIISNYTKYAQYNVRVPKGLIFEGPPGNGKTLLAKALAGEAKTSFIPVSGAQFQEKYVGVGSSRIRELFQLARDNIPCIIFIDEIDALGRKRSTVDGDTSGNERDSTLNELLVAMDGFHNTSGIFLIGATNRADLLDDALLRPGRVDKRVFIGNPDSETRKHILDIHIQGKPYSPDIVIDDLVENTNGFSGAQIENLLNEAMLLALRENRHQFNTKDLDVVFNKMIAGWQPNEHEFTQAIIDQIAIHELGHAVVGMLSKHHGKMTKVVINLSAPNTPAYTVFENTGSNIVTREALFEHLMILLAGRIAEEVFYGVSVTTGAINDFEEALKLAQKMVCYYGMGKELIYPHISEKYKEKVDAEVEQLIHDAYGYAEFIIRNSKDLIEEGAAILKQEQLLKSDTMLELMNSKYKHVLGLKI
jgi:cell division protease FtsH